MNDIEIIEDMLNREKDKLKFHKQEYEKFIKIESAKNTEDVSTNVIENAITFLGRLLTNIAKSEGVIKDLQMLVTYFKMKEKNS